MLIEPQEEMLIEPQDGEALNDMFHLFEGEDGESLHATILITTIYIIHYLAEE